MPEERIAITLTFRDCPDQTPELSLPPLGTWTEPLRWAAEKKVGARRAAESVAFRPPERPYSLNDCWFLTKRLYPY